MPPRPASATMRYRSATICPGTKRPPPMGSELERGNGGADGVRGDTIRGAAGVFRSSGGVVARGGAIVSTSPVPADSVGSSPITVAASLISPGAPQDEQNRPLEESCAPQEVQNIGGRILSPTSLATNRATPRAVRAARP